MDQMVEFLTRLSGSSPELITTLEDEISIDNMYTATWRMGGYFNGLPYTAKVMSIIKFLSKDTQVYYQRDHCSEGDIMINIKWLDDQTAGFRYYYRCAVDPSDPA